MNRNVLKLSSSKARNLYVEMKPVENSCEKRVKAFLEGVKDIATQISKMIYPSHFDFLTLCYGYFYKDGERVWVYVTRFDGSLGVIPEKIARELKREEIEILEVFEASTHEREVKGGYYFKPKKEEKLLRFKIRSTNPKKVEELSTPEEIENFYIELSKSRGLVFSSPHIVEELRNLNHCRRDGYL